MRTSRANWLGPLRWDRQAPDTEFAGRRGFWPVFCASLADVFDNEVPNDWRFDLWELIEATPRLSWLLVTKRIGNVEKMVPRSWLASTFPSNVRIIITVVNQEEADRDVPKLLALHCKNGISYEPALGPVDWSRWLELRRWDVTGKSLALRGLQWVIVGGESGPKARQFHAGWAHEAVHQCKFAGVPVFVKQMGANVIDRNDRACGCEDRHCWPVRPDGCDPVLEHDVHGYQEQHQGADCRIRLIDRAGADPAEWPADLRIQEFPV